MCDTLVAIGNSTASGAVLFAKNSDREPNEAHELLFVPAARHVLGDEVQCTYITIPQVEETYAVLLAKPFWMWGAEMGTNEHGVTIGNEAVFTKVAYDKEPGLIGMDFIRLALERSKTAESALHTLIRLLEVYGQGGNCGFAHKFYYHNSFIVADRAEAWVLETAGRQWAAVKVRDVRSISNALTIDADWDMASADLIPFAREKGWYKQGEAFNFSRCYADFLYTTFADGRRRQACTMEALRSRKGVLTEADMMAYLRSHGNAGGSSYQPGRGLTGAVVCMHASLGPIRGSQTVGSMVSKLQPDGLCTHWLTGTAAPCTGIFKPMWVDAMPDVGHVPTGRYDQTSLFWQHELLHREVLRAYDGRLAAYCSDRDDLEEKFLRETRDVVKSDVGQRKDYAEKCFAEARQAEAAWLEKALQVPAERQRAAYSLAWRQFNRQAGFPRA
jgi:dipeptidase